MKKIISSILFLILIISFAGCGNKSAATSTDANEFLTDFFASYTKMNAYLSQSDIEISAFSLDGEGLSSILKAVYQAQSISYTFPMPTEISENVFSVLVDVIAPDIAPLYAMYDIDKQLLSGDMPQDFVAQTFYDNICAGTTGNVTTTVAITLRYNSSSDSWSVDSSNHLADAIFPNINNAG